MLRAPHARSGGAIASPIRRHARPFSLLLVTHGAFAPRGKRKFAIQKHNAPPDQRSSVMKMQLERSRDHSPVSGSSPARSRPHFSATDVSREKTRVRCTIHKSPPARSRLSDHVSKTQRTWPRQRSFMANSRLARTRATCHVAKTGRAPPREPFCAVGRPPTPPRQNRTDRAFVPATSRHRVVVAVIQRTRSASPR